MNSIQKYGRLGILNGKTGFKNLPSWSNYLLEVGKYVSTFSSPGQNLMAGIVLPTRAYAAAFVAVGSTIAKTHSQPSTNASYTEHLKLIESLEPGAPVTLVSFDGSKGQKGKFLEVRYQKDKPRQIAIVTSRGNSKAGEITNLIHPEQCIRIKIDDEESSQLPVNEKFYDLSSDRLFLSNLLGSSNVDDFQFNSSIDTLIIGKEKDLKSELLHRSFLSKFEDQTSSPSELQDIIRVKRFTGFGDFSYRTRFFHDSGKNRHLDLTTNSDRTDNPTGIFDGGRAYLKWGRSISGINSVVVLPRNDRNFQQTVHQINERYYLRLDDIEGVQPPSDSIPGLETVFFTEAG